MKSAMLLAALAAVAVALVPQATARENASHSVPTIRTIRQRDPGEMRRVLQGIAHHRDETWRWQRVMRRPRTPYSGSVNVIRSLAYRKWVRDLWDRRARRAKRRAQHPPHLREWLCIHRYEGSWTDPNAPYYGGLQMDLEFQRTYGGDLLRRKGTADRWTPLEQIWVAEHAYRSRGFWPWPNTARWCRLL